MGERLMCELSDDRHRTHSRDAHLHRSSPFLRDLFVSQHIRHTLFIHWSQGKISSALPCRSPLPPPTDRRQDSGPNVSLEYSPSL